MHSPVKRNRNIGTSKQGHGQNNRFRIPDTWMDSKIFYERLNSPVRLKRKVRDKEYKFLIEPTLTDYTHSVTVDDIERIIGLLIGYVHHMDIFVLRQPTRKQVVLSSVWGRLALYYEADACQGTAIIIEAQQINKPVKRSKSLDPATQKELLRLEKDGHKITLGKREFIIESTLESCRSTQLYRTIPHELGHYVDYITSGDTEYSSKPERQKEDYAHRYADEFIEKMVAESKIPFERVFNEKSLSKDGLSKEWFL